MTLVQWIMKVDCVGYGHAQNEIANWFFYTEKQKNKLYSI